MGVRFWEILGTLLMYPGAILLALNDPVLSRYAYAPFLFSTLIMGYVVYYKKLGPWFLSQYVIFTAINIIGIYNWLLR